MKTSIKLVLIYFLMQIFGAIAATPIGLVYSYVTYGTLDAGQVQTAILPFAMLFGFIFMWLYLWRNKYLTGDKRLYSFVSPSNLGWSIAIGLSSIFLIDFLMSYLTFLPDLMESTFDVLQSGWLGIVCIAVLGPILEELLFRGSITKVLLKKYSPVKAILISGLIFGIFHLNPAQVVGACFSGFLFAWLYYRTGSLISCILIHILNNSLSVWLSLSYPDVDTTSQLLGEPAYIICLVIAVLLFLLSLKKLNTYKISDTNPITTTTEL
ncbi:CPBP family intramembrane glutamic endopeptidase [Bacteroides timonensis]|uniref:CPBP family intramembrane glutamic endopeptidase n=1 Tax=Bacteroides timonensis TaxID=1470345 RepID=UPI0004BCD29E|nr:type II CAAX endopeptidase family protein [Bacteroides timonensis]